jgi:hypothetical protein
MTRRPSVRERRLDDPDVEEEIRRGRRNLRTPNTHIVQENLGSSSIAMTRGDLYTAPHPMQD